MAVSDGIAEAAEDLFVHVRWMSGLRRERLGGVELWLLPGAGPVFAKVGRVRLRSDELDEALDGVRARLRSEGRTTSTWSLGPSSWSWRLTRSPDARRIDLSPLRERRTACPGVSRGRISRRAPAS
jgi:hypothetical protein